MRTYSIVDMIAAFLAAMPEFREGRFTLYSEVPMKCIAKNGSFCTSPEDENCLDLLVCRGPEIVLGIVYDKNRIQLVNTLLPYFPYVVVPDENWLPLGADDTPPDCPTPGCLSALYHTVLARLPRLDSLGRYVPAPRIVYMGQTANTEAWKYTLPAVPVTEILGNDTGDSLRDLLIQKCLLLCSGVTSEYGKGCGLFTRFSQRPLGMVGKEYVTIDRMREELVAAVTWQPDSGRRAKLPLSQRLQGLNAGPSCDGTISRQASSELKQLLHMPLERFFTACPNTRNQMTDALSRAETAAFGSSAHSKTLRTYQDALNALFAIWRDYSDDSRYGDLCSHKLLRSSQTALLCLSEPFLTPACARTNTGKKRGLQSRLAAFQPEAPLPLAHTPLPEYYYAAACSANCGYPNWLYKNKIRCFLTRLGIPASSCDPAALIRHIHEDLRKNDGDAIAMLYLLLVEPICRPKESLESKFPVI